MSTTAQAIAWIEDAPEGEVRNPYRAAKVFRLSLPALSRAYKQHQERVRCPMCGATHPRGTRFKKA